ncbi:MAG: rhamnan synthesis F family protein [Lachnospiraceae bacterium]|nr:rhamnan synthesis F family protein [Lachnospiraceae bacterium]
MILDKKTKNRCVIFLFFDKDGVVDRYVARMLEDLRKSSAFILTAANGYVDGQGRKILEDCSDEVIYRPNTGFDLGGYRDGIFHLGFRFISSFDELLMMNYTFFGPLTSFEDMFEEMAGRDLDFWGITSHKRLEDNPYREEMGIPYFPEHLNSHFLAIRKSLASSWAFKDYMCSHKNPESYLESITGYEAVFTEHFAGLGYRWQAYVDPADLAEMNPAPFAYLAAELIRNNDCQILKRRNFFGDYTVFLQNTAGENSVRAYEALKETGYDTELIWENILRLQDPSEIRTVMHLARYPSVEATGHVFREKEAAVFILGGKEKAEVLLYPYIAEMEKELPVFYLEEEGYAAGLQKAAGLARDYAYILVLNPFGLPPAKGPKSNLASLLYAELECTAASRAMIGNVLDIFENEKRIGLLVPPLPCFGNYFEELGDGYQGRFEELKRLSGEAGFSFPISDKNPPAYSYGGSFWIRSGIFEDVMRRSPEEAKADEGLMKLIFPLLVQEAGYLTALLAGSRYGAVLSTNLDYAMRENNKVVFKRFGPDYYWSELDKIRKRD